jgi:Ni/Fe-hydrogenase subunit HybB-like protein
MVITLAIPIRKFYHLEDLVTMRHLDNMAKVMLATGVIVAYGYMMETFIAFYSGNQFDRYMIMNRMTGPYAWVYWLLIACNIVIPQVLWSRKVRNNIPMLFIVALVVNVGMWLERFVIVVVSLHRDYIPSAWGTYIPTRWDWATYVGTIGLFLTLFYLFIRFLPMISIVEMRSLVEETNEESRNK